MTHIFISHSHLDEEIADLLIDFLSESIEISKKEIRCTSDPNHGLDFSSSSISDQLKNDLNDAGALIIIATIDSLRSPWILFEVGSFWTTDKLVAPIVGPGLTFEDLPGPLKGYRSIRIEDEDVSYQLNELINQLSRKLNLKQSGVTRRRDKKLEAFISHFRAWKSQLPDVSQQENIEDLIQKVEAIETRSRQERQELEKSLSKIKQLEQQLRQEKLQSNQAQEIKVASQREKEKLEQKIQNYKTQISRLEQELGKERSQKSQLEDKNANSQTEKEQLAKSLQSQINELEQQLGKARSQSNQAQEIKVASQREKEQLEKKVQDYKTQISQLEQELGKARSQIAKQVREIERLRREREAVTRGGLINRRGFLKWSGLAIGGVVAAVVVKGIIGEQKTANELNQVTPESTESSTGETTKDLRTTSISQTELESFEFETVTVDRQGQEIERSKKQAKFFKEDLSNGVNLDMVSIPGGKFMMGTEDEEIERLVKKFGVNWFRREKPQHEVTVQPFYMGRFQVTQAQWKAIASLPKIECDLELDPSSFKGDNRPVESVSWEEAVEFCQRLSKQTGKEYRLPSEAEWEYACRAGTMTPFHFGKTITSDLANYRGNEIYAIYANEAKGEYREKTIAVGSFSPNAFGLYDMHGNVSEWCQDDWHDNYEDAPNDGSAWFLEKISMKVRRGGSWLDIPSSCRSAFRLFNMRDYRDDYDYIGFRVVCGGG